MNNYYSITYSGSDIPSSLNLEELNSDLKVIAPEIYATFHVASDSNQDSLKVSGIPNSVTSGSIDTQVLSHEGSIGNLGVEEKEFIIDGIGDIELNKQMSNIWKLSKSILFPGLKDCSRVKQVDIFYEIPKGISSFSYRLVNATTNEVYVQKNDISENFLDFTIPTQSFPRNVTPLELQVRAQVTKNNVNLRLYGLNIVCFC